MTDYASVGVELEPWRHTVVGDCIMRNTEYKETMDYEIRKILFNTQYYNNCYVDIR